jgi:hypothetical protein
MTTMTEFDALCLLPAERFLQSVLVIDDEAYYGHRDDVGPLDTPEVEAQALDSEDGDDPDAVPTKPSPAKLNAEILVERFASRGLVCGVMRPDPPEHRHVGIAMPAAARADVVILDWHLNDKGGRALEILSELSCHPGLRLVAVYTFDDDITQVAKDIRGRLSGSSDEPYRVVAGDLVVEVYAKEGAQLVGDAEKRIRGEEDLVQQVIEDFGRLTRGIVPSAAVAVIGAIRAATPRLLSLLPAELDIGYLGHRILLPDPDESADQLLDLVGAELRTVVEDDEVVSKAVGFEVIRAYVEQMNDPELPRDVIAAALKHGTAEPGFMEQVQKSREYQAMDRPKLGDPKKSITRLFAGDNDQAYEADSMFARSMSLRTESERPPHLTLGTVVCVGDTWWICVQPVCHSVRIDAPRAFPFVPGKVVEREEQQDLIVRVDSGDKALRLDLSLFETRLVVFPPEPARRAAIAVAQDDGAVFLSSNEGAFRYVSQMRRDHAQRLLTDYAHGIGRVGLDESEVLRRWREKRSK